LLKIVDDGYYNINVNNIKIVLFKNKDRSMVFFPCNLNGKIVFLDMLDHISADCLKKKQSSEDSLSKSKINYYDFNIKYRCNIKKSTATNLSTGEVFNIK